MKKILTLTLLLLTATLPVTAQHPDSTSTTAAPREFSSTRLAGNATKSEGDSAYLQSDYASAIQIYESLLQQGEAAELYYNLGNSYYKSGDIARAILNYERALLLQPGNGDIRSNLEIARAKTIDKVVAIPDIFFVAWTKSLINTLSVDAWAKWGLLFFVLLLLSLGMFFFSNTPKIKKAGFIIGSITFTFTILCNLFAAQQKHDLVERSSAIILSPSVTVRSTPSESGTALFILHEGHKVEVKDNTMREWKEILLPDGKVGWIPATSLEVI